MFWNRELFGTLLCRREPILLLLIMEQTDCLDELTVRRATTPHPRSCHDVGLLCSGNCTDCCLQDLRGLLCAWRVARNMDTTEAT